MHSDVLVAIVVIVISDGENDCKGWTLVLMELTLSIPDDIQYLIFAYITNMTDYESGSRCYKVLQRYLHWGSGCHSIVSYFYLLVGWCESERLPKQKSSNHCWIWIIVEFHWQIEKICMQFDQSGCERKNLQICTTALQVLFTFGVAYSMSC